MKASELMTRDVQSCTVDDSLQRAAQIMWDRDCGIVPVVDADQKVVGVVTDRDVAMAAFTQGRSLSAIPVSTAMAKKIHAVGETDSIEKVEALMRRVHVRRVPVLDSVGRLKGIVSMNDLARHAHDAGRKGDGLRPDSIVQTLAAVCEPRAHQSAGPRAEGTNGHRRPTHP